MNKITAHFISIYFALIKETKIKKKKKEKKKKTYIQINMTVFKHLSIYLFFLNKIFQYIFRLLYDYGAEASQCPTTSTV